MDKGNLLEALREDNCWLQFKVKWKGWSSGDRPDGTTWEDENLLNCDELLFEYVQDVRQKKLIPLPGQLDCMYSMYMQYVYMTVNMLTVHSLPDRGCRDEQEQSG